MFLHVQFGVLVPEVDSCLQFLAKCIFQNIDTSDLPLIVASTASEPTRLIGKCVKHKFDDEDTRG